MSTNKVMKTFAINNSPVYEIMDEVSRNSIDEINKSLEKYENTIPVESTVTLYNPFVLAV